MKLLIGLGLVALLSLLLSIRLSQASDLPAQGQPAPAFDLPDQTGKSHTLKQYAGRWVVLYFYPKDDTPGCTQEACAFRDDLGKLTALGAQVIGVSVDDTASHAEFAAKYHLPFPLLADKNGAVATRYGALRNFGVVKFAKRYTFLIDPQGRIAQTYLKVDTSRHSDEIIRDLTKLTARQGTSE
jgi:thioredoxin-dependent peroxiredoxin